ncbi:Transcription factor like [Quillaja saponaria]|uniref:Transcription factor like n=1 Tax=Quillaja saponaria TaxID=32244 RepID=A0AAD7P8Q5_QUISA|nr:Transcription factor like [Quillaja saponaria]
MTKTNSDSPPKLDRKTVERNRRIHMKGLCFKLATLIPHHYFKATKQDMVSQQDQLDLAATYIKRLTENIDKLKRRKEQAMESFNGETSTSTDNNNMNDTLMTQSRLPVIELIDLGSGIEVVLISGLKKNFMMYEIISVLEEEGAEVVSASFSTLGDKIFHTIHAQVKNSRVGVETTRVWERLHELVTPPQSWNL